MKLRAFIGSSSESLNVANAVKHALRPDVECQVWTESFFKLSQSTIETLSAEVDKFDVGIFVFAGDDQVSSREEIHSAPRDNVIFEHGLFCGRLGAKRTFVIRPTTKDLKWLSDLEGFTPAKYDGVLAKTNADLAVKPACEEILGQLRRLEPREGIFVNQAWKRLGYDLWTYAGKESSSTVVDESGIQFLSSFDVGLQYPKFDNINANGRYIAFRLAVPLGAERGRFYISLSTVTGKIFLSISNSHDQEGWGVPQNEFMIRLPHLQPNQHEKFVIDLEALLPLIGAVTHVNGFRLRPGLKISHFGVCDTLPVWLQEATELGARSAPALNFSRPAPGAQVNREEEVEGTVKNLPNGSTVRIYVFSPDKFWYRQRKPIVTGDTFRGKAFFGNPDGPGGGAFRLAGIVAPKESAEDKIQQLPASLARSFIDVMRRIQ